MYSCLSYPACKSQVVFDVSSYTVSSTLFHKNTIFEKKFKQKSFDFSTTFVSLGQTDGRTDGQTDRHDEANSRLSQFCESP